MKEKTNMIFNIFDAFVQIVKLIIVSLFVVFCTLIFAIKGYATASAVIIGAYIIYYGLWDLRSVR